MKAKLCKLTVIISMAVLAVLFISGAASFDGTDPVGLSVTRAVCSVAFTAIIVMYGYRIWHISLTAKELLFSLPAMIIAVNNFPWLSFFTGSVTFSVTDGFYKSVFFLAAECLLIGIFEETAFRGVIMMTVTERFAKPKKSLFSLIFLTSAVFGLAHIFNLFAGAGILPTLQQIGYSFLIGGMCAIVLFKTRSLPAAILIHALYDFCGFFAPHLGIGKMWTTEQMILTAAVAVPVFVFYLRSAFSLSYSDAERIFKE